MLYCDELSPWASNRPPIWRRSRPAEMKTDTLGAHRHRTDQSLEGRSCSAQGERVQGSVSLHSEACTQRETTDGPDRPNPHRQPKRT